jgi:hypothetical protein
VETVETDGVICVAVDRRCKPMGGVLVCCTCAHRHHAFRQSTFCSCLLVLQLASSNGLEATPQNLPPLRKTGFGGEGGRGTCARMGGIMTGGLPD